MTTPHPITARNIVQRATQPIICTHKRLARLCTSCDPNGIQGAANRIAFGSDNLIARAAAAWLDVELSAAIAELTEARNAVMSLMYCASPNDDLDMYHELAPYGQPIPTLDRPVAALRDDGLVEWTTHPATWFWVAPEWSGDPAYEASVLRATAPLEPSSPWPRTLQHGSLRQTCDDVADHITCCGTAPDLEPDWAWVERHTHPTE